MGRNASGISIPYSTLIETGIQIPKEHTANCLFARSPFVIEVEARKSRRKERRDDISTGIPRASVGRLDSALRGAVRGRPGRLDRERGAAQHWAGPSLLGGGPAVGGQRLRDRVRGLPAPGGPRRGPARPAPRVHGRAAGRGGGIA